MRNAVWNRPLISKIRRVAVPLLVVTLGVTLAGPASAHPGAHVIVLPGASSAEGMAAGRENTFFAGDLYGGNIFRGDLRQGTAQLFIDAPEGRYAGGMKVDLRYNMLFVAGGPGRSAVYNSDTGATLITYQFGDAATSLTNDVELTSAGAWFTDSKQAKLYFVPISQKGVPGQFRTLQVTGPAAYVNSDPNIPNLNGIVAAGPRTLIVAHTYRKELYTVDTVTGASAVIAGIDGTNGDGLLLEGLQIWVVQGFSNQISRYTLSGDLRSGHLEEVIKDSAFRVPTTAAKVDGWLLAVNSHFDTGIPPKASQYEVVVVGIGS